MVAHVQQLMRNLLLVSAWLVRLFLLLQKFRSIPSLDAQCWMRVSWGLNDESDRPALHSPDDDVNCRAIISRSYLQNIALFQREYKH